MNVRYPNVTVPLSGEDGNAFFIISRVRRALRHANVPDHEIDAFTQEAHGGTYDHVLRTVMAWVEVT